MTRLPRQTTILPEPFLPYGVRDLLRILASGDYPESTPPREVMLIVRRRGWTTGAQLARTLEITPAGRHALEIDNAARSRRPVVLRTGTKEI